MSAEEQRNAGVVPEMIRLSIGIEHIDDILADLKSGPGRNPDHDEREMLMPVFMDSNHSAHTPEPTPGFYEGSADASRSA